MALSLALPTVTQATHPTRAARVRRALRLFVEETAAPRRAAAVDALERETAGRVAKWFVFQGQVAVRVLGAEMGPRLDASARRESRLREDISWEEWDYLLNGVFMGNHPGGMLALRDIISDGRATAYARGAEETLAGTGLGVRFAVGSPAAVAHARAVAAAQVTRINDTTRDQLRTLITQAVENGWSWNRTAEAITERYKDFAGAPLFPSRTFRSRAEMVAAYEIGDAYEAGSEAQALALAAEGVTMEKSWLDAGDARVRPAHRANAAAGWIPLDATFPDGSRRSPTDAGCRCAVAYRAREAVPGDDATGAGGPDAAAVALAPIDSLSMRPEYIGRGVAESVFQSDASERARQRAMKLSARWDRYTRLGDAALDLDLQIALAIEGKQPEERIVALEKQLKRTAILRRKAYDHYHAGARAALALPEARRSTFTATVTLAGRSQTAAREVLDEVRQMVSATTLPGDVRVRVARTLDSERAYATGSNVFLTGSPYEHMGSSLFHEMGHVIEDNNEMVSELAWAFHRRRTRGESPVALNELAEYPTYDAAELTWRDEFIDPYMGKVYTTGATEIVSTGLQYMRHSPEDLAARDPDYFHFMYHLLRGDLDYLAERMSQ
jgi:hypothetical protein